MRLPINMTEREFKVWKRRQFKNLCSYIESLDIRVDSAYLPKHQFELLHKGIELIYEARRQLRPWWRRRDMLTIKLSDEAI